ncbi:MAG: helix-turn-helix domain-containing protein [Bacteroides sp.]|nr:helix-turn-helix domain-containing protein [Roseburia sp.]MCM1463089.1 helix-turn-helix domain-containing protein [Bacteroides sp.]
MTIGERILNRREALDKKQYEIAEEIGVTKATMCKYERGQNLPNAEIVARLAAALETSADYLCGVTDDPARRAVGRTKPADEDLRLFREFLLLSKENKYRVAERIKILLEEQEREKVGRE